MLADVGPALAVLLIEGRIRLGIFGLDLLGEDHDDRVFLGQHHKLTACLLIDDRAVLRALKFDIVKFVGHMNKNWEVDASISYADYYYLEALIRLKRLESGRSVLAHL